MAGPQGCDGVGFALAEAAVVGLQQDGAVGAHHHPGTVFALLEQEEVAQVGVQDGRFADALGDAVDGPRRV